MAITRAGADRLAEIGPLRKALQAHHAGLHGWAVDGRIGDVQTLSVVPDARGGGVGTQLMTWSGASWPSGGPRPCPCW